MESLSTVFFGSPPLQNHLKTQNPINSKPRLFLQTLIPSSSSSTSQLHLSNSLQTHLSSSSDNIHQPNTDPPSNHLQTNHFLLKRFPFSQTLAKTHFYFVLTELITNNYTPPCFASESLVSSSTDQVSANKIDLEALLVTIDNFFNRYPFFVAGCTFIWLVVIPLTQEYFRKYKFIYAIDAFRKLRDDPNVQLLDIRDQKSLRYLKSPNLKIINKSVVQVQFSEDDTDGFIKKVLENFKDPANTVICILDNLDGNSLKVAELLFKNGFKAAYAIKNGIAGKKGWIEIQETLLPPSTHIYPKKRKIKQSEEPVTNGVIGNSEDENKVTSTRPGSTADNQGSDRGHVAKTTESILTTKNGAKSSSPYPNYPDLKPPSSPTPSKPSK
ncbi:rhodanese-like domain-containing protein 4A, chloroplastic [Humulus lupulus]|uniref:rhodanese-like domain-containing protein 4A, chloroplastic n=1 Tax=Humulus lupulus TaxID=3486 RepID=UPI002B40FA00|nr:rhodanese-like domain-containing protein 4A, chloroplastic [Humulus lupulus]